MSHLFWRILYYNSHVDNLASGLYNIVDQIFIGLGMTAIYRSFKSMPAQSLQ